ncbi:transposon Tf2-9 polyprotein [Trichonephila clavipes]|nr:transposon Tf2-9 polyprotein [Trichonephila clavipes]
MTSQYFRCHRLKHYRLPKELRQETSKDIELGPLLRAYVEGKDLQGREAQYTIEDGCIMYGQRVCIPRKFRKNVLEVTC